MGDWWEGQWIVVVVCFQKIFDLFRLKCRYMHGEKVMLGGFWVGFAGLVGQNG